MLLIKSSVDWSYA